MNHVRKILACGLCGALPSAAHSASGQPVELIAVNTTDGGNPPGTTTCNLLLHFSEPGELLVVQSDGIGTDDPGGFFQSTPFGTDTAPLEELLGIDPTLFYDSYVDIGLQIVPAGGTDDTVLTPDWISVIFNTGGAVVGDWFAPPTGQGQPDGEGNVFIAQFTVGQDHNVSGQLIAFILAEWGDPLTLCPDLNGDLIVDQLELIALLSSWGNLGDPADFDGDGIVGVRDLAILLASWGPCGPPFPSLAEVVLSFDCLVCTVDEDCDDGDICTDDVCDQGTGQCVHTPIDCDDGDICTVDGCDPVSGCFHVPDDCDDGIACTLDSCDPLRGCLHEAGDCPVSLVIEDQTVEQGNPPGLKTCALRVHFDQADELMAVLSTDIHTDDPGGFHQAAGPGGDLAPLQVFVDLIPELVWDSYVDLGIEIVPLGGTDDSQLLPDWDSGLFNTGGQALGGWFAPPTGQGLADGDGNVFIAQFTAGDDYQVEGDLIAFVKADWGAPILECPDLDSNGVVNVVDLGFVLGAWGECPPPPASCPEDLNGDGVVDIIDVVIVLVAWGPCGSPPHGAFASIDFSFECFLCTTNEDCDDGNDCTEDICDPANPGADENGCVYPPAAMSTPCEADGDLCTLDHCDGDGSCVTHGIVGCPPPDGPCDGGQACNPSNGQCEEVPDPPLSSPCDADGDPCTVDHCDGNGQCVFLNDLQCTGDLNCDGRVNAADLALLLGNWGPCNDDCPDALAIGDGDTQFDTTSATTDGPPHAQCPVTGQTYADTWYRYTATCTGNLTVSTCNQADYNTDLVVYEGCDCDNLVLPQAGCSDPPAGCEEFSQVVIPVTAGNCYTVRIGGIAPNVDGSGTISITCTP